MVCTHPRGVPRTLDGVEDTTTDGAHGEGTAEVVEDDPWAARGLAKLLCQTAKTYQGSLEWS